MRVCIVGASGKLGQYMVQHALDRGYEVVGVCREQSVAEARSLQGAHHRDAGADGRPRRHPDAPSPDATGCSTVLAPTGRAPVRLGTAQAVLDHRTRARAPGVLVRVAHHARRPGQLLAAVPDDGGGRRAGLPGSFASPSSTTRCDACRRIFESDDSGPSCAAATSRRARARACPCGAGTSATPSSRATSRAAWTSPCSWWRHRERRARSTRLRRSSAARRLRRSRTPQRNELRCDGGGRAAIRG